MSSQTYSLNSFIRDHAIGFYANPTERNPNIDDWQGASHWRCVLKRHGARMTVAFSQGEAHTKPPVLADVLDCLASDASGYENAQGFEDWASEYGYETDSRKAERTYKAIARQAASLKRLLGEHAYQQLLWNTERQ